jgi:hypothetical protein
MMTVKKLIPGKSTKVVEAMLMLASLALLVIGLSTFAIAGTSDRIFKDGFDPPIGVVLQGEPGNPAMDALILFGPIASPAENIVDEVLLDRVDVVLRQQSTVGEVNDALASVGARIVSMRPERAALTLVIPRQNGVGEVRALASQLRKTGVFRFAFVSNESVGDLLPPGAAGDETHRAQITHLLPTRFPAAWNAYRLATRDCESRKVPILVVDHFHPDPPAPYDSIVDEIPGFQVDYVEGGRDAYTSFEFSSDMHGYKVASVLASLFDETNPTGAMPFTQCLNFTGFSRRGLGRDGWFAPVLDRVRASPDNVILSASFGNAGSVCGASGCQPGDFEFAAEAIFTSAVASLDWIDQSQGVWANLFVSQSGGNFRSIEQAAIYPGYGLAPLRSELSLTGALGSSLESIDTRLSHWLQSPQYWAPSAGHEQFPSLQISGDDLQEITNYRRELGIAEQLSYFPVTLVGVTSASARMADLRESFYSNRFPDVSAPADPMFTVGGVIPFGSTSLATPQVAGLAAYLWLLSPELRAAPALSTKIAIEANVDAQVSGLRVIDAYATALSLDDATTPTPTSAPVRLAILDLTDDGLFDETDLALFGDHLIANVPPPEERSYDRFDLNGDGATGGTGTARFDLDRVNSVRFGTTQYNLTTQYIEGVAVPYNENALTDLEILCYYAYSPLYTGDTDQRTALLGSACSLAVDGEVPNLSFLTPSRTTGYFSPTGEDSAIVTMRYDPARFVRRLSLDPLALSEPEDLVALGLSSAGSVIAIENSLTTDAHSRNQVVITWRQPDPVSGQYQFWAVQLNPQTQQWLTPELVHSGPAIPGARILVDELGNAALVWIANVGSEFNLYARLRSGETQQWSASDFLVEATLTNLGSPSVALRAGRLLVGWGGSDEGFVRSYRFGEGWAPKQLLFTSSFGVPQVGIDGSGGAIAVMSGRNAVNSTVPVMARHLDHHSETWSSSTDIMVIETQAPSALSLNLLVGPNGTAMLAAKHERLVVPRPPLSALHFYDVSATYYDAFANLWAPKIRFTGPNGPEYSHTQASTTIVTDSAGGFVMGISEDTLVQEAPFSNNYLRIGYKASSLQLLPGGSSGFEWRTILHGNYLGDTLAATGVAKMPSSRTLIWWEASTENPNVGPRIEVDRRWIMLDPRP